jgi:hypothetical protein
MAPHPESTVPAIANINKLFTFFISSSFRLTIPFPIAISAIVPA